MLGCASCGCAGCEGQHVLSRRGLGSCMLEQEGNVLTNGAKCPASCSAHMQNCVNMAIDMSPMVPNHCTPSRLMHPVSQTSESNQQAALSTYALLCHAPEHVA